LQRTRTGDFKLENAMTIDFFMENIHLFETNS